MYERFTDRARKIMQLANQEAARYNHEYIGTEHILLGLLAEGTGVAVNVLKNLDIDLLRVRREVEKIVHPGPEAAMMGRRPQTPRAKKVIEYAIQEAHNLGHNYVGTEHLLLGLIREMEGLAAQVLMNCGARLEQVREEVLNLLGHAVMPPVREPAPAPATTGRRAIDHMPEPAQVILLGFERQIANLQRAKDEAIAEQSFDQAAALKDIEASLQKLMQRFVALWAKTDI